MMRSCTRKMGSYVGAVQREPLRASGPSARSTSGLTSLIISSIERIAALCGVAPTLKSTHGPDGSRGSRPAATNPSPTNRHSLLGYGLDIANQQIVVDLFVVPPA
jgi:hypothetical protein